jgi:hypothetical protein
LKADPFYPRFHKIVTTSENYPAVLSKLQEEGLKFETDNGCELIPLNPLEVHCLPFLWSNIAMRSWMMNEAV